MPDSNDIYIELSYLQSISGGDAETEKTILKMLLDDMEQLCPLLRIHLEAKNIEELEKVAHKLKSSLAFSGNEQLMKANDQVLEIARTQERVDRTSALISQIEELTPLIIQELQKKLGG